MSLPRSAVVPLLFVVFLTSPWVLLHASGSTLRNPVDAELQAGMFINPRPGARHANPQTTLSLRPGEVLTRGDLPTLRSLHVVGSLSGVHTGEILLARDNRTVIFKPDQSFLAGETVTVASQQTGAFPALRYSFRINPDPLDEATIQRLNEQFYQLEETERANRGRAVRTSTSTPQVSGDELNELALPDVFPEYSFTAVDSGLVPGYLYLTVSNNHLQVYYAVILDNEGEIKFFKRIQDHRFEDLHPMTAANRIAYFDSELQGYEILDGSTYVPVDTITGANGYDTDMHELLMLEDGTTWQILHDYRIVDLTHLGGREDALVLGMGVQEQDPDGNVVFEWLSLDYIPVGDSDDRYVNYNGNLVDYCHMNTIELDDDGNLLLSLRNLHEITKVNYDTGEIMWRLGGGETNEFEYLNNSPMFSMQHDIRRLDNGNITLFDNGVDMFPEYTYVKEYEVDTVNMSVDMVWSYAQDPPTFSMYRGNSLRHDNDNTVIGWGLCEVGTPLVSEINLDGEELLAATFYNTGNYRWHGYRAYKSPLIGVAEKPYVDFSLRDSCIVLYMYQFGREDIVSYDIYLDTDTEPTTFFANTSDSVYILHTLDPSEEYHVRVRSINEDGEVSGWSNEMYFEGRYAVDERDLAGMPNRFTLLPVYPNPFNSFARIRMQMPHRDHATVRVLNTLGREVEVLFDGPCPAGVRRMTFDGSDYASGVYFIQAEAEGFGSRQKRLILVK